MKNTYRVIGGLVIVVLIILAVCLVFLAIAQRIFTRLEGKFAERL